LESLVRQPPDLVVLDLMVPKVDGLEITRWLRERGDTPIIMLTARREERDRIAGLEMGADDYVVKPFSPQELVSRVRAVCAAPRAGQSQACWSLTSSASTPARAWSRCAARNAPDGPRV
jgi:DNA-binding response OmpR family regulator